ncbi:MAG TPA: tetratricopeptide repeat protein [Bacteroidales bacterium]|nr:tetratricopeptide repeat protein [Bacteroidales bacterium]
MLNRVKISYKPDFFIRGSRIFFLFLLVSVFSLRVSAQPGTNEQLAIQYFQDKEFEKALILFEEIYNKTPTPFIYDYCLKCMIELQDYNKAEKFVSKVIRKSPGNFALLVDLGYVYQLGNETEKAKKQFENTIKTLSADKDQINAIANAFLLRNQPDYAIKAYEQGRKLLRNFYRFELELADIYLKKNDFNAALEQFLEYAKNNPSSFDQVQSKLQDLLVNDPENVRNNLFRSVLLQRIKKEPDIKAYPELLLWYFIQEKEFGAAIIQAKAIDKRFNEDGGRIFDLAKIAVSNAYYDDGIACYDYILSQKDAYSPYYQSSLVEKLNTRYLKVINTPGIKLAELELLEKEYYDLINKNGQNNYSLQLIKNLAHLQAFYLDKAPQAIELLQKAIQFINVSVANVAQCKIELADILLLTGDIWEASLLYSQVEKAFKNDVTGFEAKFRNAKLYFYINEFEYAKAQLDILKAATSKLIANDAMELSLLISDNLDDDSTTTGLRLYARAELLLFQNKDEQAFTTLDSINMLGLYHSLFDEVLYKKAQIRIRQGRYADADTLLVKLVSFYQTDILADDALFKLGELNENIFKNTARAMEFFEKILTDYPGSIYVVEARRHYRILRGDKIN